MTKPQQLCALVLLLLYMESRVPAAPRNQRAGRDNVYNLNNEALQQQSADFI